MRSLSLLGLLLVGCVSRVGEPVDGTKPMLSTNWGLDAGSELSEAEACEAIRSAHDSANAALDCHVELPECSQLFSWLGEPECSLYEAEAIETCAERLSTRTDCGKLKVALAQCDLGTVANSAPSGC
jgi:hypothetical protein